MTPKQSWTQSKARLSVSFAKAFDSAGATANALLRGVLHAISHGLRVLAALLNVGAAGLDMIDHAIQETRHQDEYMELDHYITPLEVR